MPKKEDICTAWLKKESEQNMVEIRAKAPDKSWQKICTRYWVLAQNGRYQLIHIDLLTGRTHQIRAHLASQGIPVIGDMKYGDRIANEVFRKTYGVKGQLLHAYKISFICLTGILQYLNGNQVIAKVPEVFQRVMEGEGLCLHGSQED